MVESITSLYGPDEEKSEVDSESLLLEDRLSVHIWRIPATRTKKLWMDHQCLLSILAIALGSIGLTIFWVTILSWRVSDYSYEQGFRTEIALPFKLPLVEIRFRNSPLFPAEHTMAKPPLDGGPWQNVSYWTNPGEQEDLYWERLIQGEAIRLTVEEARRAWPDHYQEYYLEDQQGYVAALDVHHTLHCLNTMRKLAYPDIYTRPNDVHIYHCGEILRQQILCYGSTTLVPTKYRPEIHHDYIDSDQVHTCRNFDLLQDYMIARKDPESPLYVGPQPRE